jgi:hypothetical protein
VGVLLTRSLAGHRGPYIVLSSGDMMGLHLWRLALDIMEFWVIPQHVQCRAMALVLRLIISPPLCLWLSTASMNFRYLIDCDLVLDESSKSAVAHRVRACDMQ